VSFSEAAQEASMSRIYNSNHTRLDEVAGENLGHDIAGFVLARDMPKGTGAQLTSRGLTGRWRWGPPPGSPEHRAPARGAHLRVRPASERCPRA
jgi:hypothetical protein